MQTIVCGRPLTFGDIEQIAVINSLRAKEEEKELRKKKIAAGELVEFEVDIRIEGTTTVTVEASSEQHARELARDELNMMDIDVDEIDIEECRAI